MPLEVTTSTYFSVYHQYY